MTTPYDPRAGSANESGPATPTGLGGLAIRTHPLEARPERTAMSLPLVHPATAPAPARELPAEVHRRLGANPHHGPGDGNGPALFRGYLDLSGTLSPACSALPPHVALNVLTNDFNKAARVALDFPAVVA